MPSSEFECLRRDIRSRAAGSQPTTCVLCALRLEHPHPHLVDCIESSLGCACRSCARVFANIGDLTSRYRTVPSAVRFRAQFPCRDEQWQALRIPSNLVFVFRQSAERRWVAMFPSSGGPARFALDQAAWDEFLVRRPLLANLTPDVEALLVRRQLNGNLECFGCPIDRCYALVCILREQQAGIDGRRDARKRTTALFAELRRAAEITHAL